MAAYQDKAKERIKKGLARMTTIIDRAIETKTKEADTRQIVVRILADMLGWCEFENLTGEYAIRGGFADFMLQKDGERFAVIEVKPVGVKLNDNHVRQARDYAINEGIEWVIVTNANQWKVYRILFNKNSAPDIIDVFSVQLNDSGTKPAKKVELLYLLSEESFRKHELLEYFTRNDALSATSLACHLMDVEVLNKIRLAVRKNSGHKVTNHEVAEAIVGKVLAPQAIPDRVDLMLKKVASLDKKGS